MKFLLVLWLSKLAAFTIKLIDKNRGTDFPGKLAYKLDKNFMRGFKGLDYAKVIFITGTNGKSTTTNLLYHTLKENGRKVIANLTGSNMLNGAAAVLISGSKLNGRIDADHILIEVDERSFPYIIRQLPGKNILITNIMQDQVHRNGDPDFIYQLLRENMPEDMVMFLNNDEPRSKSYEDLAKEAYYYGVAENSVSYNKEGPYEVTMPCPYCFAKIRFHYMNSANVGNFSCTHCSFSSSRTGLTEVQDVDFQNKTFTIGGVSHPMPYDAPIMLYNYAGVSAVCRHFGLGDEQISKAFGTFVNLEGRIDVLHYKGREIHYMRIKQGNPETIQMAVDAIAMDPRKKLVALGMCIIPERRPQWVPHYTNTYYAYETNFRPLLSSNLDRVLVFSDYVAYDQKNRLLYDGFEDGRVDVLNSEDPKTVLEKVCSYEGEEALYLIAPLRNIKLFKAFLKKCQE